MLSPLLWTTPNLGCTPPGLSQGASQNRGAFLATSGELHWDAQPTTLDNPKSGMHPSHRGCIQDYCGSGKSEEWE